MEEIKSLDVAIKLLVEKKAILFRKVSSHKWLYYVYKDDSIMLFNESLKTYISLEDFKNDFFYHHFYLYENKENDEEIDQEFKPIRQ